MQIFFIEAKKANLLKRIIKPVQLKEDIFTIYSKNCKVKISPKRLTKKLRSILQKCNNFKRIKARC